MELVRAKGHHVATGFLGTPLICDALTDAGAVDDAYRLLRQTECPSWLYPVTMGATTIWERWDSMLPDGSVNPGAMTSFNHYAFGAVADWMHRVIGGLAPASPGYRQLRIEPRPGGGLTWARTSHVTPYGLAEVSWRREHGTMTVDVTVPAGLDRDRRPAGLRPCPCWSRAAPVQRRLPGRGRGVAVNGPSDLRVEHLTEPLGLGSRRPRLSWRLPPGTATQRAYRIRLESGADSGWVNSSDSVLVRWPFAPLASLQRVTWQVQVETDLGESRWSPSAAFETGLLDAADWTASWIRPAEADPPPAAKRPAYELRGVVTIGKPVVRARLYATALGIYEVFLGGRRVGDLELTPGFTQYAKRLQVQAYDVTGLVTEGATEFTALLSDGWFRGQTGITRAHDQFGDRTAFLAQLRAEHPDGTTTVVGTDGTWQSRPSHITAADLIGGQSEDRRLTGRAGGWEPAQPAEIGYERLAWSPSPPVRRIQEIPARSVTRLADGRLVADLGQNINGWIRLGNLGQAGTELTLVHGEALDAAGDVTTDHLRPAVPFLPEPLPAGMIDRVISAGRGGDAFEPRHTTHGFRYIRVEGHPGDLTTGDVTGVVVHTDMRQTGSFTCSDDRINALHEAAVWSFRDNACDIPTDCPHRERAGWTGDWQLYVATAAFLYDVAGFSAKWLRDVAADQWDDGTIANISPAAPAEGIESPVRFLNGSAGWGDAIVIVPWEIYRAYGDEQLLAELWPNMVRWLDRTQRTAATARHPSRTGPVRPHERYLWDTGFHWGEWLEPGDDMSGPFEEFVGRDKSDVATAYYARSAELMSRIATVLRPRVGRRPLRRPRGERPGRLAGRVHRNRRRRPSGHPGHYRAGTDLRAAARAPP